MMDNYKNRCYDVMNVARNEMINILSSLGNVEVNVELKRDLGDFVDYMTAYKIENGVVYFMPTEFCPDGLEESFDMLSANELYDLIMGTNVKV